MAFLIETLKRKVFSYISRSLFKADRLTFAMHLVHCVHPDAFKERQWQFFTGELVPDASAAHGFPYPSWASAERKQHFHRFCNAFPEVARSMQFDR
jgi:dynein heavy chain 2